MKEKHSLSTTSLNIGVVRPTDFLRLIVALIGDLRLPMDVLGITSIVQTKQTTSKRNNLLLMVRGGTSS